MIDLSHIIVSKDGLLGKCKTCRHDGHNRGVPTSMCDIREWWKEPGSSCRFHEPTMVVTAV